MVKVVSFMLCTFHYNLTVLRKTVTHNEKAQTCLGRGKSCAELRAGFEGGDGAGIVGTGAGVGLGWGAGGARTLPGLLAARWATGRPVK